MTTTAPPTIFDIFDEIVEQGLLEDQREYDVDLLKDYHQLSDAEAVGLEYLIQREFDPISAGNKHATIPSWIYKECYLETTECNFEGYTALEHVAILKYHDDLRRYWLAVKNEPGRDPKTGRSSNGGTYGSPEADA